MSHGINLYDANSQLIYSTTDVTWNQVDFFRVEGGSTATKSYPVIIGKESLIVQMFIDPPPTNRKALAHTVVVSNGTVSVTGGSEATYILVLMR